MLVTLTHIGFAISSHTMSDRTRERGEGKRGREGLVREGREEEKR